MTTPYTLDQTIYHHHLRGYRRHSESSLRASLVRRMARKGIYINAVMQTTVLFVVALPAITQTFV